MRLIQFKPTKVFIKRGTFTGSRLHSFIRENHLWDLTRRHIIFVEMSNKDESILPERTGNRTSSSDTSLQDGQAEDVSEVTVQTRSLEPNTERQELQQYQTPSFQ